MAASMIAQSVALFLLAGLCEIGGGWLVWQWFREGRGLLWGFLGGYSHPLRYRPNLPASPLRSRLCGLWWSFHCPVASVGLDI
jgi:hypothetical protein